MTTTETGVEGTDLDSARPSRAIEVAFAVVALATTATYLYLATQVALRREADPGQIDARFWPILIGTAAVIVSLLLLVVALTKAPPSRDDIERIQPGGIRRVVLTIVLTVAYVAAWSVSSIVAFGYRFEIFPIITALYLVLLMLVYGQRRVLGLVLYPIAVTGFIYVLFGMLLRVPL